MSRIMKALGPKALAPLVVLSVGTLATIGLVSVDPARESTATERRVPLVPVAVAKKHPVHLEVHAQGSVEPRTETDLVLDVAGRIEWMSPALETGAYFEADAPLLRVDPRDYDVALARATAAEERAASQAKLARAALERRRSLRDAGAASTAGLEEAENQARVAEATLREARATRDQAELDLERTELRAPFDGRVRERRLAVGQFASRGTSAARIFETRSAQIRLSIPTHEVAFLDLPTGAGSEASGPVVSLSGMYAGRTERWTGRIMRTEGALDPKTRMVVAVAEVDTPSEESGVTLPIGLFVDATIAGRPLEPAIALPRAALRGDREVFVVSAEGTIELRAVEILRASGERIWIRTGLEEGEQVAVRVLGLLSEGMKVRAEPLPESAEAPEAVSEVLETVRTAPDPTTLAELDPTDAPEATEAADASDADAAEGSGTSDAETADDADAMDPETAEDPAHAQAGAQP